MRIRTLALLPSFITSKLGLPQPMVTFGSMRKDRAFAQALIARMGSLSAPVGEYEAVLDSLLENRDGISLQELFTYWFKDVDTERDYTVEFVEWLIKQTEASEVGLQVLDGYLMLDPLGVYGDVVENIASYYGLERYNNTEDHEALSAFDEVAADYQSHQDSFVPWSDMS